MIEVFAKIWYNKNTYKVFEWTLELNNKTIHKQCLSQLYQALRVPDFIIYKSKPIVYSRIFLIDVYAYRVHTRGNEEHEKLNVFRRTGHLGIVLNRQLFVIRGKDFPSLFIINS